VITIVIDLLLSYGRRISITLQALLEPMYVFYSFFEFNLER